MEEKLKQIIKELKSFFDTEFRSEYFTIIYGSYAYGVNTSKSDLDFVTVSKEFSQRNLRNTLDFAFNLYEKYDVAFDDEVPHEKKLLANYKTLDKAIHGRGFERRNGRICVPPVVKSKEFLNSDEIAMRLLLNAITSKNIFVCGDINYYSQKREHAFENMIGFMFSIDGVESFKVTDFVQSLIGTSKRHGEMYLGYKDKAAVRAYLFETFRNEFGKLSNQGKLKHDSKNNIYTFADAVWFNKLVR